MHHALFLLLPLILAGTVRAECPAAPDLGKEMEGVLAEIREAPNEMNARSLMNDLWKLYTAAPDETAQELLDRGMEARESYDFLAALEAFDKLVEYCPDYAEGYNQRAFVNFLREDFAPALVDLDRALAIRPNHLGALSGKALTLMGLDRQDEAQLVLKDALELNPWLPERGLVKKPRGQDL